MQMQQFKQITWYFYKNLEQAREKKKPKNLPKDGCINNSWEFTLFSWQEPVKLDLILAQFAIIPNCLAIS